MELWNQFKANCHSAYQFSAMFGKGLCSLGHYFKPLGRNPALVLNEIMAGVRKS